MTMVDLPKMQLVYNSRISNVKLIYILFYHQLKPILVEMLELKQASAKPNTKFFNASVS